MNDECIEQMRGLIDALSGKSKMRQNYQFMGDSILDTSNNVALGWGYDEHSFLLIKHGNVDYANLTKQIEQAGYVKSDKKNGWTRYRLQGQNKSLPEIVAVGEGFRVFDSKGDGRAATLNSASNLLEKITG